MRFVPVILAAFTLLALANPTLEASTSKKPEIKITGTFSDIYVSEETGDVCGTEISVIFGGGTYWVLYQEAEGELAEPKLVKAKVKGVSIEFTVTGLSEDPRVFKGKISQTGITGSLVGMNPSIKLKRKNGFWQ